MPLKPHWLQKAIFEEKNIEDAHRFSLFKKVASIFKTGSTLKCRKALDLDFTTLTHLRFSVALYITFLHKALVVSFGF